MRMPGFTAEASLDRTSKEYLMAPIPATAQGVVPQQNCYWVNGRRICCWCDDWGCWCTGHPVMQ